MKLCVKIFLLEIALKLFCNISSQTSSTRSQCNSPGFFWVIEALHLSDCIQVLPGSITGSMGRKGRFIVTYIRGSSHPIIDTVVQYELGFSFSFN
jgi:hypothetical protein